LGRSSPVPADSGRISWAKARAGAGGRCARVRGYDMGMPAAF